MGKRGDEELDAAVAANAVLKVFRYGAHVLVFDAEVDIERLCVVERTRLYAWAVAGVGPREVGDRKRFGPLPARRVPIGAGRGHVLLFFDRILQEAPRFM